MNRNKVENNFILSGVEFPGALLPALLNVGACTGIGQEAMLEAGANSPFLGEGWD